MNAMNRDAFMLSLVQLEMGKGATRAEAVRRVAEQQGLTVQGVSGMASRAQKQELTPASSPETPHTLTNKTVQRDANGNIVRSWERHTHRVDWGVLIQQGLKAAEELNPRPAPARAPAPYPDVTDLVTVYPLADLHLGLYTSLRDSGDVWDLETAVEKYRKVFCQLLEAAPRAYHAIVANLGDFTHIDNHTNRTPRSGAVLDASGRYGEIVEAAVKLATWFIDEVAAKHTNVNVVWLSGNHDEATGQVMQAALRQIYRNDDFVNVMETQGRFAVYEHHLTMLAFTHGDTVKPRNLPLTLAARFPVEWGATRSRFCHVGHVHHATVAEHAGIVIETHNAPVPADAWHHSAGYSAQRKMTAITYGTAGEVSRASVNI